MLSFTPDTLWKVLLELKTRIGESDEPLEYITVLCNDSGFSIELNLKLKTKDNDRLILITKQQPQSISGEAAVFLMGPGDQIRMGYNGLLDKTAVDFLLLYLPYCLWTRKLQHGDRSKAVIHFAQTLDGRIATHTGHSKWISDREDLVHAHRMRALCDAVLIGAHTLVKDKPALTVRHVEGQNPVKIVIGNSSCDFSSLLQDDGRVILITNKSDMTLKGIENVYFPNGTGYIPPSAILKTLYEKKIRSVYVEGGSATSSNFLSDGCIDMIQLYFSPRILGSGITNFNLPLIERVNESVHFSNISFTPMGEGMLFQGTLHNGRA